MKDCVLIATLPSLNSMVNVRDVFSNPYIAEVRFNTGAQTPYSIEDTLDMLKELSERYNKKLWIDIKGRQLRVTKWADPLYSCVEISHRVQVSYPAIVCFRNGDRVNIAHIKDGNKLFVNPLPRNALGAGQSVNILAENVEVEGYLTEKDKSYLLACKERGLNRVMASFVESFDDLAQILQILPNSEIVSKIESLKGIEFIEQYNVPNLMAARDDLYLQTGQNCSMLNHLRTIISRDSGAICASKIFLSLEYRDTVDLADYADLELMYSMGYRKFMLCDNICNYSLAKAIEAWKDFING